MANWPPPMGKWPDRQTGIKHDFAFLFFTFLLLLPREIVLEREHTMADEEHFFLPTSQSEYACLAKIDDKKDAFSMWMCICEDVHHKVEEVLGGP